MGMTPVSDFEKAARDHSSGNLLNDCWEFLQHNKKWWLLPIILVLVILGALVLASGTAAAPFIYTLF
jgi:hypothetical protein